MIFIVGGAGFVGSGFCKACEKLGKDFTVLEPYNYKSFVGQSCDVLINANGNSRKFLSRRRPIEDFDASVRTVRASLIDFDYKLYVYLSSCDVYPDCSSPATTLESQDLLPEEQSPYGFHKSLAEQCVRHAAGDWLIVRFGGFVGPRLWKNPIFDILYGDSLWLDPESELQFLHTEAGAEIVLNLIDRGIRKDLFNVCGRGVVRLAEVMDWAKRHIPVQPDSPKVRYEINIDKLAGLIEVPKTRDTVEEFVKTELESNSSGRFPRVR